jgi:hypothetical protein
MIMRKMLVLALLLSLMIPLTAHAQGGKIPFDEWVEGTLTATEFEHFYTFQSTAGTLILVEMLPKIGTYDLDPQLAVRTSTGNTLIENDDTVGLDAVVVVEIPEDGEYTIVATRSGGIDGSSEGEYQLRAREVALLQLGDSVEATVYGDTSKDMPNVFVVRPATSGTWAISFTQPEGELHAAIEMVTAAEGDTVFELGETNGLTSGTLNVSVEADVTYLITVQQSFLSFVFEDITIPVEISIAEVAQ